MPPTKISFVRHAQGYHNSTRNYALRDPLITPLGRTQCAHLSKTYPHHDTISLILVSPLRRTIQTAVYSFGPALARKDVKFICLPSLQEVADSGSDTGADASDLPRVIGEMFKGEEEDLGFDLTRIDLSQVEDGWNSKKDYYAYTYAALSRRAADVRNYLFALPTSHVVVVTHGAIAHFITEDWDVDDAMTGTAYNNCEVRDFTFTTASTPGDAHLEEMAESRARRGGGVEDPHVVEELEGAVRAEEGGEGEGKGNGNGSV